MPAILHALATAAPPSCSQSRAADVAAGRTCFNPRQTSWMKSRFERSGIERRGSVLLDVDGGLAPYEEFFPPAAGADDHGPTTATRMQRYAEEAPRLATAAARRALERAELAPGSITHLVTISCTGFMAPGLDTLLIPSLELSPQVGRAHLGFMGCHGAFNGLGVAEAFAATASEARVLVCAAELSSLHLHYGHDRGKIVANALFADGATAFVVGGDQPERAGRWRLLDTASCMLDSSLDAMTWVIGDHGFEMGLDPAVPYLIRQSLRPWLDPWLARHGLDLDSIRSWAIHPGGPLILDTMAAALELPESATAVSREVLARHGNMSSATLGFILESLMLADAPLPCVAFGFGPGLIAEGALFV